MDSCHGIAYPSWPPSSSKRPGSAIGADARVGEAQALSRSASQQAQTLGVASVMSTELIRGYEESLRNPGRFSPDAERDWLPAVPPFTNWSGHIQRNTQTTSRNYDDIDGFLAWNVLKNCGFLPWPEFSN
ncbi:predicted protein [Histoplasma capsulatum G186AR]|uniref:Uncharacterized protein n=1 Tax=Ajellomyces capsulatus (strain G186AR / H82 / ATCC MYA-2454 / RMSCC 2432) TaxID=447093 RepID=C0NPR7_AJECG|nr:uncharacterized protein HCBG_05147 [Histoplasma capsulatum G186AR]EEH06927.1 predicted protein [Histoplasma capsulatum G186AR]